MPTACSGLLELRGYIGANASPERARARDPSGAVTADPAVVHALDEPLRTTSTRIGSDSRAGRRDPGEVAPVSAD